jgi:hypothetical protein
MFGVRSARFSRVTDHRDRAMASQKLLDCRDLRLGQQFGTHFVDANLASDRFPYTAMVSRQHHQRRHAETANLVKDAANV